MVLGAIGLTTGTASADQKCSGTTDADLCMSISAAGGGNFTVHVGIDVFMSREEAQEHIDDPGDPFTVWIRGYDGRPNEFLFTLPTTFLEAGEAGLSADFERTVPGSLLNEDVGTDEVVAVITLTDTDTKTFVSPVFTGDWS